MKDIVILNHDPLIQRIKDGFCIDSLKEKGYNVRYVDLSNFYFPKLNAPYQHNENYVVKLSNEKEILDYLHTLNLNNTIFIAEAMPQWKSRKIYRFLSESKAKVIKITIYPSSSLSKKGIIEIIKTAGFKKSFNAVLFRIYRKLFNIKLYDKILTSNILTSYTHQINHPDFDTFKKDQQTTPLSEDYIVFLDEAFPVHPEILYWAGQDLSVYINPYRESLTKLFDYLEETFKKKVVICGHPKANYKGGEFGHHKIVVGETPKYVRQSAFVMMHVSSSVSFAILNNKPIVFLSSDIYRKNKKTIIDFELELAQLLGEKIHEIDAWRPSPNDIHPLDSLKRDYYKYTFLTSKETENKINSEIIQNVLKES